MFKATMLAVTLAASTLQAGILWDQSALGTNSVTDQDTGDSYASYIVNDIHVNQPWVIDSISTYYQDEFGIDYTNLAIPVHLMIFAKTGTVPGAGDDPNAAPIYTGSLSSSNSVAVVTISGLNLSLAPGDYWIGEAPVLDYNTYGIVYLYNTTTSFGDPSAWRNPGGSYELGTDWQSMTGSQYQDYGDGAILITSSPEPGSLALMTIALAAIGLRRRAVRSSNN